MIRDYFGNIYRFLTLVSQSYQAHSPHSPSVIQQFTAINFVQQRINQIKVGRERPLAYVGKCRRKPLNISRLIKIKLQHTIPDNEVHYGS